jgi:RNA-directed DNA polymerase
VGPSKQPTDSSKLYDRLRARGALHRAWAHVYDKAKRSRSSDTRSDAERFASNELRNIERIEERLRKGMFRFEPAKPILIAKKGKKDKRPVVVAPIASRIVQRALLDLIQERPEINQRLKAGHNFGGVEGSSFGVPPAIKKALEASKEATYYIRTDIKSFFTAVPRAQALEEITKHIADDRFNKCLVAATDTELQDIGRLGEDVALFPLWDDGVAQGSCLSPLLCNLLLADFDGLMNRRGIVCIRYIDDFILFAKTKTAAFKALAAGSVHLSALGLELYDPQTDKEKAAHGFVEGGFAFLGCDVKGNMVRPSTKKRTEVKDQISEIFDSALGHLDDPKKAIFSHETYAEAIARASRTIRGWGNTYSFCTDEERMRNLDLELGEIFEKFGKQFRRRILGFAKSDKRRALGLFLLADCNKAE